jgi:TRAP-type mannitol/chloroaromatic compound transport system substrate-binding protein
VDHDLEHAPARRFLGDAHTGEQKMKTIAIWPAAILMLGLSLSACTKEDGAAKVAGKEIHWKMASSFAATSPINGSYGPLFSNKLLLVSGGRLDLRFYDPGKLVPALEVFDSVSKGAVDAGWTASGYWIGKMPAAAWFTAVPFGPDLPEYLAWVLYGGGLEMWRELYAKHNVWVTPCVTIPPEASGWFRNQIDTLDQLKGLKIRFFGLGGKVMQKLGASVQLLAGGDIYPALERGVIDATEYSVPSIDLALGFHKVAKHYYFPGWHQPSTILELIINLERWKELSPGDQALIELTCKDTLMRGMTLAEMEQGPALAAIKKEGVQVHTWSPQILLAIRKVTNEVFEEEAKNDADFARVYESYKTFRANYKEWAALSRVHIEN